MAKDFQYANGQTISQARSWFKFTFGDFFIKAEKNNKEQRFDIFVYEKAIDSKGIEKNIHDFIETEDFKRYWGKPFNLILLHKTS